MLTAPNLRLHLLAAPVVLLAATPALPCSLEVPAPTLDGLAVPDEGATMPTNGVVHAAIFTGGAPVVATLRADTEDEAQARTLDIDEVAGLVRVNLEGLLPSTSYTLTLRISAADAFTETDLVRDIHFLTSADADSAAPTIAGDAVVTVDHYSPPWFPSFDCGGGEENNVITITPPEASDDVALAGIKLFRMNEDGTRELRRFALGQEAIVDEERVAGDYAYELVAVDVAGNESAPLDVPVNVSGCSAAGAGTPALCVALALFTRRTPRLRLRGR